MSGQPDTITEMANLFRAMLEAREQQAVTEILAAYSRLYERLTSDLDLLLAEVAEMRAAGETISAGRAARIQRLAELVQSVEDEVRAIAGSAESLIAAGQRDLVEMGIVHAHQLVLAGIGTGSGINLALNRVPANVVETMVGFLRPDTPLGEALDRLPGMAAEQVRESLVRGVATGRHPRVVARDFREAIGGNAASAERLARTAQIHAYRTTLQETYRQNPTVVRRWRWSAALDTRTCMSCIAMHGKEFPHEESLVDHWNGRCTAVPVTVSWTELLGEEGADLPVPPTPPTGQEWFLAQSPAQQRRMLGRAKYHAWQAGEMSLDDLSIVVEDAIWGPMRVEASLRQILGDDRARYWYVKAAEIDTELVPA